MFLYQVQVEVGLHDKSGAKGRILELTIVPRRLSHAVNDYHLHVCIRKLSVVV